MDKPKAHWSSSPAVVLGHFANSVGLLVVINTTDRAAMLSVVAMMVAGSVLAVHAWRLEPRLK